MKSELQAQIKLIDYIDREITSIIQENNGARTKDEVLVVFNATLLLLHEIRSDLYFDAESDHEETVNKIMNILGGK